MRAAAPTRRRESRSRLRTGLLWLPLTLLVIAVAAILALPYGLRYGLERWLYARGAETVSIGGLSANPFSGAIRIHDLRIDSSQGDAVQADELRLRFSWRELWERQGRFDRLSVQHAQARLQQLLALLRVPPEKGWSVSFDQVQLSDVALQLPLGETGFGAHIDQGVIEPWSSRNAEASRMSLTGTFEQAPLRLQGTLKRTESFPQGSFQVEIDHLDLARLAAASGARQSWQGQASANLRFEAGPEIKGRIELSQQGTVRMQDLRTAGADLELQSATAVWEGEGTVEFVNGRAQFQHDGRLTWTQPEVQLASGRYRAASLEWRGRVDGRARFGVLAVTADGTAQAQAVAFQPATAHTSLTVKQLQWHGAVSHGALDVPGGLSAHGNLLLNDLHLRQAQRTLFSAAGAQLHDLDLKGAYRIAAGELDVQDYRLLDGLAPDSQPLMRGERARFADLTVTDRERFSADGLRLEDTRFNLRREPDGRWWGPAPADRTPADSTSVQSANHSWRIGRIELDGQNSIHYEDRTVSPVFARTLQVRQFSLSELDSAEPARPSPVALQASLADGTRVVAVGKLHPFAEQLNFSLKTKVSRLPLAPLSPYSEAELGLRLDSGSLNAESELHVLDGELRSRNELELRGLQLQDSGSSPSLRGHLQMPLDVATALVQDRDDVVHLELPLRADLQAPELRFGELVNRELGEALQAQALATLSSTLYPFGVASKSPAEGSTSAARLRLEPLSFRPGAAELNQVTMTYLRRVANLLQQHPALQLRVCGIATDADRSALGANASEQAVARLARARGEQVAQALGKASGLDGRRVHVCGPATSAEDPGRPRAELSL